MPEPQASEMDATTLPASVPARPASLEEAKREAQRLKFSTVGELGWAPKLRERFGYFTPNEVYEGLVLSLVDETTTWLDVGCGHRLFPGNEPLARALAARCRLLVGIDPDETIERNTIVHRRVRSTLEDYHPEEAFDLVTLRMVAEHITEPEAAVAALARLTRPGGRVVIYTVSKWAPASLAAAATPMAVHHFAKKHLWGSQPEDTFPTAYRMNTRAALARLFTARGFAEERFLRLDDCRTFSHFRAGLWLELSLWRGLHALGLNYPELCLLGVYRRA